MKLLLPAVLLGTALMGCSGGSEATASKSEEEMYKNPPPVDTSKLPANAFDRPGPHFVGTPSGASNPKGSSPPPAAVTGG